MDDVGTYQFSGWSPAIVPVSADTTYAAYTQTPFVFSAVTYTYHSDTSTYSAKGNNASEATAVFVPSVPDDGTNGSHPVAAIDKLAFSSHLRLLKAKIPASIASS